MRMGITEWIVILAIVLIVGGYKVLPKIANSIKESIGIIKEDKSVIDSSENKQ